MAITTIITTYQRPHLLKRAVLSVLNQTYSDFKICVFDNHSNDETFEIMQEFVKKDPRIKYHRHEKNIGMMANYEFAYRQIDSPYFSFLSDDDFVLPHFFETALESLKRHPDSAFSACGIVQIDDKGNHVGNPLASWKEGYYKSPKGLFEMIGSRLKFPVPTGVLFQTKIAQSVQPEFTQEIALYWDPDYLMRLAAKFPFFINKKCCGIYIAYPFSFCNSYFSDLTNDYSNIDKYLTAVSRVKDKIKGYQSLSLFDKRKCKKTFKEYVTGDVISFFKSFSSNLNTGGALYIAKKHRDLFGFSLPIFTLKLNLIFIKYVPFSAFILNRMTWLRKFMIGLLLGRYLNIKIIKPSKLDLKELESHLEYGSNLINTSIRRLDENF